MGEMHSLHRYLTDRRELTPERATQIVCSIVQAAALRAGSHFELADSLINEVLNQLPAFPPALAGKAHSCILQNLPRTAIHFTGVRL